ncbi:hypothetical protein U7230_07270 [Carboxydochorda subterranea]|uniref:Spore germination protein n=1 Tax=Carboxydichorda subterranea TaxID=3109565 RepID=A0ABZ1C1M4_9FIRM|nr:hypothetical protein [Limnochorda sp. L945t]WRP18783.1 hypothetical protein U7230_07270 [Limnochorda sp. L945t]
MSEGQLAAWATVAGLGASLFLPDRLIAWMGPASWVAALVGLAIATLWLLAAWTTGPAPATPLRAAPSPGPVRGLVLVSGLLSALSLGLTLLLSIAHMSAILHDTVLELTPIWALRLLTTLPLLYSLLLPPQVTAWTAQLWGWLLVPLLVFTSINYVRRGDWSSVVRLTMESVAHFARSPRAALGALILFSLPLALAWVWSQGPRAGRLPALPRWSTVAMVVTTLVVALHTAVPVAYFGPAVVRTIRDPFFATLAVTTVPGLGNPRAIYLSGPGWMVGLQMYGALMAHAAAGALQAAWGRPLPTMRAVVAAWLVAVAFIPLTEFARLELGPLAGLLLGLASLSWLVARWAGPLLGREGSRRSPGPGPASGEAKAG